MDALELLARYGDVQPADEATLDAAALAVLAAPDLCEVPEPRQWSRTRRTLVGVTGAAAAAAMVVGGVALASGVGSGPASPAAVAHGTGGPAGHAELVNLAGAVLASPPPSGDATLVIRTQQVTGAPVLGADLYTDSGEYFYAPTPSGLPAQVTADNNLGDGMFGREVAAAEQAATGDLASAAVAMETAPAPTVSAPPAGSPLAANWLWENSQDALIAGAGNPLVRAGVVELVSTLPNVTVVHTSVDGVPALRLTATFDTFTCTAAKAKAGTAGAVKACAVGAVGGYKEALTINAVTGVPISFAGGASGTTPEPSVTYQVSRVTLAQVAAGNMATEPSSGA